MIIGQTMDFWIFLLAEGKQEEEPKGFLALQMAAEAQGERRKLFHPILLSNLMALLLLGRANLIE